MGAYCGRPTSAYFCDRFTHIVPTMRSVSIAEICSMWALRYAVPAARKPGVAVHGHSCDACVAPLATAIISQTGS